MPSGSLTARVPRLDPARALADLVVPPAFASATLETYLPDPAEPSQAAARDAVARLAAAVGAPAPRRGLFRRAPRTGSGLYLDGGFGVGKTHLLAAAAHAVGPRTPVGGGGPAPAFGTFVQYTALVGALGFAATRDALRERPLVCIDEFELDDPGDTVLVSTLLGELAEAGVHLAATSNTLPGALGEDRFAAEDFVREIQGLAARFAVVRVDGPDHRHRDSDARAPALGSAELDRWVAARDGGVAVDDFAALVPHLGRVHPAAYGAMLDGVPAVAWRDVVPLADQDAALRLVSLVDRLYDRGIPLAASGVSLTDVFPASMLAGGYRKKYGRARSRMAALAAPSAAAPRGPTSDDGGSGGAVDHG